MDSIIPHQFNNSVIIQLAEETIIAGKPIPSSYCNLTQMCKANGKRLNDYTRLKRSNAYIHVVAKDTGIPVSSLLVEILGVFDGDASLQGTWGHHLIALSLAAWISPDFELWANKTLWAVVNGDFRALTAEAKEAENKLKAQWQKIRNAGKVTRRSFTDSIKDYCDLHPELSPNYRKFIYSNCSDKINRAVFGKSSRQLQEMYDCDKNHVRDSHEDLHLTIIDRIEDFVMRLTDRGLEPMKAADEAIGFYLAE
jgi:hypothetical protein